MPGPDPRLRLPRRLRTTTRIGPWYRIHRSEYEPVFFGRGGAGRFDDPAGEYGVLYVAASLEGAVAETFGHSIGLVDGRQVRRYVRRGDLEARALSLLIPDRPLRLANLSGAGLHRHRIDAHQLTTPDKAVTQGWSRQLYEHASRLDGILYHSRLDPTQLCAALFGGDRAAGAFHPYVLGRLTDERIAAWVAAVLRHYGYLIVVR